MVNVKLKWSELHVAQVPADEVHGLWHGVLIGDPTISAIFTKQPTKTIMARLRDPKMIMILRSYRGGCPELDFAIFIMLITFQPQREKILTSLIKVPTTGIGLDKTWSSGASVGAGGLAAVMRRCKVGVEPCFTPDIRSKLSVAINAARVI